MEEKSARYHYQVERDPYAGQNGWDTYVHSTTMNEIMDAFNEYIADKEEN